MTIKLKKDLWARVTQAAASSGYSSPEEFVEHVLEKACGSPADPEPEDDVLQRLRGLGYID